MSFRIEVLPFLLISVLIGAGIVLISRLCRLRKAKAWAPGVLVSAILCVYMLVFFRDPPRVAPPDPALIVSGADGKIAGVKILSANDFLRVAEFCGLKGDTIGKFAEGNTVRISIFLSLIDVHVNRAPIAGESRFLGYFPGKHIFTFKEKSSDYNQHNSILIGNDRTICLFNQIVGPVARRVVYWLPHDRAVSVEKGAPIGMMKFGSRLDMYFPEKDIEVLVEVGQKVRAGETVVARLKSETSP